MGLALFYNPDPVPSNLVLIRFFDMLARKLIRDYSRK